MYFATLKRRTYALNAITGHPLVVKVSDRPDLTVFELRSGRYELVAEITGDDAFAAELPFSVTIVPARLVMTGPLG